MAMILSNEHIHEEKRWAAVLSLGLESGACSVPGGGGGVTLCLTATSSLSGSAPTGERVSGLRKSDVC